MQTCCELQPNGGMQGRTTAALRLLLCAPDTGR